MDDEDRAAVLALAERVGFGFVMHVAAEEWAKREPRAALVVGPCRVFTQPCDHRVRDANGHCALCSGCGWLPRAMEQDGESWKTYHRMLDEAATALGMSGSPNWPEALQRMRALKLRLADEYRLALATAASLAEWCPFTEVEEPHCPACGEYRADGHDHACALAAALKGGA